MTALYLTLAAINGSFMAASFSPTYEYLDSLVLPHYSFLPQVFAFITSALVFPPDSPPIPFMSSRRGSTAALATVATATVKDGTTPACNPTQDLRP